MDIILLNLTLLASKILLTNSKSFSGRDVQVAIKSILNIFQILNNTIFPVKYFSHAISVLVSYQILVPIPTGVFSLIP